MNTAHPPPPADALRVRSRCHGPIMGRCAVLHGLGGVFVMNASSAAGSASRAACAADLHDVPRSATYPRFRGRQVRRWEDLSFRWA